VQVLKLNIDNFRNIETASLEPHPQINFFIGPNGAGKTSVLESLVVMAKGRSFRSGSHKDLIGPAQKQFQLHCQLDYQGKTHHLGVERSASKWRGRLDGEDVKQRAELARLLPHICIDPDSHLLIDGGPEKRRRYLDWTVFHVKPDFLSIWVRHFRALKQRNALLKQPETRQSQDILTALDQQLGETAKQINELRYLAFDQLQPFILDVLAEISPGFPPISLQYSRGWSGGDYAEYLLANRHRDAEAGQTLGGPHRANIECLTGKQKSRDILSRGQQKALSCAMLVAQAEHLLKSHLEPIFLLDDPESEFDGGALARLFGRVSRHNKQIWITSVSAELPERPGLANNYAVFHVKHGRFRKMV